MTGLTGLEGDGRAAGVKDQEPLSLVGHDVEAEVALRVAGLILCAVGKEVGGLWGENDGFDTLYPSFRRTVLFSAPRRERSRPGEVVREQSGLACIYRGRRQNLPSKHTYTVTGRIGYTSGEL